MAELAGEVFSMVLLRVRLRSLLACAAVLVLAVGVTACGSASKGSGSTLAGSSGVSARGAAASRTSSSNLHLSRHDGDGDIDRLTPGPYDTDNDATAVFGPAASATDRRAILALIRRYYTVAAAGEGAKACSMQYVPTAESVVEAHHWGEGPVALQGGTCAQIMSKLFRQRHRELVEDVARYRVLAVEVLLNRGYVLVRFGAPRELRELQVLVHREHGVWKMDVPLDNGAQ